MAFTYIIIDSNITSKTKLHHHFEDYKEIKCIALTEDDAIGLSTILKYKPNIVFINLDDNAESYFKMATEIQQYFNYSPIFIGLSKNKDLAYDAIKNNFFDYYLLPINEVDIRKTLLRIKKIIPKKKNHETICLKSLDDYKYICTHDILYLKADNGSTDFIMKDTTINDVFKDLETFVDKMPVNFVRIHKDYVVNINYVSGISYSKSVCTLKLRKLKLPFSKAYKCSIDKLNSLITKNVVLSLNNDNPQEPYSNSISPNYKQLLNKHLISKF